MRIDFEDMQNSQIIESEHKPVQPLNKKELRICRNSDCGYQTFQSISSCPKCRRLMLSANEFRIVSSLFIPFGGLILLGGIGLVISLILGKSTWSGSQSVLTFLYLIFGAISAFGLSLTSWGLWGAIYGKSNDFLLLLTLLSFVGILLMAGVGRLIFPS